MGRHTVPAIYQWRDAGKKGSSSPDIHWQKIRTNNPLERIMREIRRRTRVVGAFPDGQSCLNLAAARLRYIVGTAWSTKCYMNMRPLYQPQLMQTEAVA